jgi:integrase
MFNNTNKELFFTNAGIKENTKESYARIFNITEKYEEELNKDISEFNLSELENIFYNFKANNRNTIESYARIISGYLNWCKESGIIENSPLANFRPNDFEKYMLNQEEYITEEELRILEDNCANYQDSVILRLIFIGVGGRQLSEISNLKKEDIDWNGKKLLLKETLTSTSSHVPIKFFQRYMNVDDYTLELLDGAIKQEMYMKRNGLIVDDNNGRIRDFTDLIDNDYVIRPSKTKTDTINSPCDKFVLYRRLAVISETLDMKELTAKLLQRSGMVHYANSLNSEGLSIIDLKMVAERFSVKSYHNLKGFLKIKNTVEV